MEFLSEEKDGLFIDLTLPKDVISQTNFIVKEGSLYKIRISFQVQREIVTGVAVYRSVVIYFLAVCLYVTIFLCLPKNESKWLKMTLHISAMFLS